METDTTLVRANGIVKLHAIAEVGLNITVIIGPGNAESEDTVGLNKALDDTGLFKFRMLIVDFFYAHKHFLNCLQILFLTRVLSLK